MFERSAAHELETAPPAEILSLQYIRAFASLGVVFFHSEIQVNDVFAAGRYTFPLTGRFGVDLFFVLSGYVMWLSSGRKNIRPAQFLLKRLARIVPLYWVMTIAVAATALVIPSLLRSTVFDIPTLITSLLFVPWPNAAVPPGSGESLVPLIVPGWTLNFEMFFYLLFACSLSLPLRLRSIALCGFAVLAMIVAWAIGDLWAPARFYTSTLILEFIAGVLIAQSLPKTNLPPLRLTKPLLLLASACLVIADAARPDLDRSLYLGIPAAVVVICALKLEAANLVKYRLIWNDLGDASYSIYLVHIFVVAGARVCFRFAHFELRSELGGLTFVLAAVLASALAGLVVHKYVERPLVRRAQRLVKLAR